MEQDRRALAAARRKGALTQTAANDETGPHPMWARVERLAAACSEASQPKALADIISAFGDAIGFEHYLLEVFFLKDLSRLRCVSLSNFPDEWRERYRANRYYEIDPVIAHCRNNCAPLTWSSSFPVASSDERLTNFVREAHAIGMAEGITIPLHGRQAEWGFLMLTRNAAPSPLRSQTPEVAAAKFLAAYVQDAVHRIASAGDGGKTAETLTKREKECLIWIAEGKTARETASILNVSERTVVFHLENAMEKLEATNRIQVAAKFAVRFFKDADIFFQRQWIGTMTVHT